MRRLSTLTLLLLLAATGVARADDLVPLSSAALPLAGATHLGSADPATRLTVGVALSRPQPTAETAALNAMYDPTSAQYHHFMTPKAFAAQFGVAKATVAATRTWLQSHGMRVVRISGAGDYFTVTGTVAQADATFSTTIARYQSGTTRYLANTAAPRVPSALPVLGVLGLNTFLRAHRFPSVGGTEVPTQLSPQDLWSIYDQPGAYTGKGQHMGIMIMGKADDVVSDLRKFETENKLPQLPVRVVPAVPGGNYSDDSGEIEWALDTQASSGMSPNADGLVLYQGQTLTDADQEAAFSAWANDPDGPAQANASFGECETTPANSTLENPVLDPINVSNHPSPGVGTNAPNMIEPVAEPTLKQAVMEGRTLFSSTGDTGSSCPALVLGPAGAGNGVANEGVPLVNYPAASDYAVAVGGSVVYSDGGTPPKRGLEYVWPYTGGGQSFFITAPPFQNGVANISGTCISEPDGTMDNNGKQCRGVPDVAAESGDIATSDYNIVAGGQDTGEGGTSLSSPLWMGMWTRIQSASPNGAAGDGFANYPIYAIGKDDAKRQADFYDLTVGSNGAYRASSGWDYVSGFGAPDVAKLLKDVTAVAPAAVASQGAAAGGTSGGAGSATGSGSTPAATCTDKTAPVAAVNKHGGVSVGFKRLVIRGTASDKGCGAGGKGKVLFVAVSVARRLGSKCRFVTPAGRLGPSVACSKVVLLPVKGTTSFSVSRRVTLPRGHYVVLVQAVDGAGNKQALKRIFERLPRIRR